MLTLNFKWLQTIIVQPLMNLWNNVRFCTKSICMLCQTTLYLIMFAVFQQMNAILQSWHHKHGFLYLWRLHTGIALRILNHATQTFEGCYMHKSHFKFENNQVHLYRTQVRSLPCIVGEWVTQLYVKVAIKAFCEAKNVQK